MFICNRCLKLGYDNQESMVKSGGACEICNTKTICNNIPSEFLRKKEKLEPQVEELIQEFYNIIAKGTQYTLSYDLMRKLAMQSTALHLKKLKEFTLKEQLS